MTLHHTVLFFHAVGTKCEHLHARVTETISRARCFPAPTRVASPAALPAAGCSDGPTILDLWVGGTLSHQKKSLEAQHLASPPVPFVAANEAGLHYSGPGAGCDPHQQSAPIREMQEEQHMGPNAAQTDKQPISEQKLLLQEGPCCFAPR